VQNAVDRLEIRIIPNGEWPSDLSAEIINQVNLVLPGMNIHLVQVDELETHANGKTRVTIGLPAQ
jgi:hypothetical protein